MPSLVGTYVANNYRQQIVPFSRFGTRKVAWYKIGWAHTGADGVIDMETVNKIISGIQTQAEIVMVGAPTIRSSWGKFMVAVFEDTANDGENTALSGVGEVGYNPNSKTLEVVLRDLTGDSNLEVSRWYLYGAPGTNFHDAEGWDQSNAYEEYDTKAQFVEDSYTNPPADPSNP